MAPGLKLVPALALLLALPAGARSQSVEVVPHEAAQRVDVLVDGALFTSYLFTDTLAVLKKPVLYPVRSATGQTVTRGFPLEPRPGEPDDHPHQVGFWFAYEDVNGLDFWNHSNAVLPEKAGRLGTIRHREIRLAEGGEGKGVLEVSADWLRPDGAPLLREATRFVFRAAPGLRSIDRVTTLTAAYERVVLADVKDGLLGLRVAHALEHAEAQPEGSRDPVTGRYRSSEGVAGMDVWGTRAPWVLLSGTVEGAPVTLALFDHPANAGFPTYWHARGYGLFAANPLGQKVFSEGREELNLTLDVGQGVTFRHRLVLLSGEDVPPDRVAALYETFVAETP